MPIPQTIAVPMPRDKRVLHLAKSLALPNRTAWAMTGECWQWLLDEADGDRVDATDVAMLDSVVSHEGFGRAMLDAGLVGTVDNALLLPQELLSKKAKRTARNRRYNEKKKASPNTKDTAKKVSVKQATLGQVAGCTVKVLTNKRGQLFYKAVHASPDLTGSVTDAENPTLLDALLAFAEKRKREAKGQPGVQMVPTVEQLALAADRLLEDMERDGETPRETPTRLARRSETPGETPGSVVLPGSTDRKSLAELALGGSEERLAKRLGASYETHGEGVSRHSSSSSSNCFSERNEKETTTKTAAPEAVNAQQALVNQILQRTEPIKHTPVIKSPEAIAEEERVQRIAEALDISPGSVRAQEKGTPGDLARRLREHGRDRDGFKIKKDGNAALDATTPPEPVEAVNCQEDVVEACKQRVARASVASDDGDSEERRSELIRQLEAKWHAEKELQDTTAD